MILKIIVYVLDSLSSFKCFVACEHMVKNDLKGLKAFSWLIGITKRINRNNGV